MEHRISYCRECFNGCGIEVDLEEGVVVRVDGDRRNPLSLGYCCVKGRSQSALLRDPERLLRPMKRRSDGTFEAIGLEQALDEIAARLADIIQRSGPSAVASYLGTMATANATTGTVLSAFMDGIGSPLRFSPNTIDKPGKMIAAALHGRWGAPSYEYDQPEVALLFGMNPLISYQGVPRGNPAAWIRSARARGMKLVVVDPRRTETARLADIHIQPLPGHDVEILAALIRTMFSADLVDHDFIDAHVRGAESLREAVMAFTPEAAGLSAGVDASLLDEVGQLFGRARRGYIALGTGPNMSGPGVLLEYLALCLETICGHWMRAGENVRNSPVLLPIPSYRAAAEAPVPATGLAPVLSATGIGRTAAGVPIAAFPAQIGDAPETDRVRALISCAGNPVAAWPDTGRVIDALGKLELLVQIDPWMSETARMADYVIPPKMALETPGVTQLPFDTMSTLSNGYGLERSFAQWTDAVVEPPVGSELVDDWEVFWGLAERLDLPLTLTRQSVVAIPEVALRPGAKPTTAELLERLTARGRIPLEEVRAHRHGAYFDDPTIVVDGGGDRADGERLDVANAEMISQLGNRWFASPIAVDGLTLVCRRMQQTYNSSHRHPSTLRGRPYNPVFVHPDDLAALRLERGSRVLIESEWGAIEAIAEADPSMRPGVASMVHCFGDGTDDGLYEERGANTCRLLSLDVLQPLSAQPVMSAIPVTLRAVGQTRRPFRDTSEPPR